MRATEDELANAHIEVLEGELKDKDEGKIPVKFNPSEYTVEKSVTYSDQSVPGRGSPITQFVSGGASTLSMKLLFDTYEDEDSGDVREKYTKKLDKLLAVDGALHAPPVCLFQWGSFEFTFVFQRLNKTFTMFRRDGTPVRATVDATLKRYSDPTRETKEDPHKSADKTKFRRVKPGDSLWGIAGEEYGDPAAWRTIAAANDIDNPRQVEPGTELTLPPLED